MPSQTWIAASDLTVDLPHTERLRVQLVGGSVSVVARTEPGSRVAITRIEGNPLEVTASAQEVSVGYASIGWDGWAKRLGSYRSSDRADVRVELGPGTAVRLATVSAPVSIERVAADVTVASATGGVDADSVSGALTVRTASGPVTVGGHAGSVRVNTVSGAVSVAGDVPKADVAAVSGRVDIITTRATSVVAAQVVSGVLDINVPAHVGVDLKARTVTAPVFLDGVDRRSSGGPSSVRVDERGGGQAAFVDVYSVTGAIHVTRGDRPALMPATE